MAALNKKDENVPNKPTLSFWQIWNMSFGFLGIQFGWGLQMANMSSIYRYLGAEPDKLPYLWLAAPLTGLIIQPIIGYMSDRTWNSIGRRKPYFLVGAICASICLFLMPNSSSLWMAAGLLWILDASINISMEPFRAFVSDMLPDEQHTKGFTMQSFFIGLGSVIASALPFIFTNWIGLVDDGSSAIPTSVRYSFYIGGIAFIGAVLYTVLTTKEYPPADMEAFMKVKDKKTDLIQSIKEGFSEIIINIRNMPKTMQQISIVQFLTWPGLFLMWFYFGDAVATHIFDAPNPQSPLYKEGSEWGGLMFAFYSLVTFAFAFLLKAIADKLGKVKTHSICLLCGALGLFSVGFIHDKYFLLLSMTGVGIAWTSILSMPYAILAPSLPSEKMGLYMGIFNFFIVLPEIIATLGFGLFMKYILGGNSLYAVMLGGVLLTFAAIMTLRVQDKGD